MLAKAGLLTPNGMSGSALFRVRKGGIMAKFRTPKQWRDLVIGKQIDTDSYPRTNPYQCWDHFDQFCREIGFEGSRKCSSTRYVGDLWMLRDTAGYNYSTAFDYIYDPNDFRDGDWVFWDKHVAMFLSPNTELGQNQPYPYVTEKEMNWNGILGAMRWKGWQSFSIAYGASDVEVNGHKYTLYRQGANEKAVVIGAGLNEMKPFEDLTVDTVYAKAGGANYFQMREDIPDQPYGTTYGDVSSPCSGMYQSLPNQDSTLFFDLEDRRYGDCTYFEVDRSHNVFSPSLIFPNVNGHFEYAKMVGTDHINHVSSYCFVLQMPDGYALGRALDELSPKQIAADFEQSNMERIMFLDGGGSAQYGRWTGTKFEYIGVNERQLPSVVAIIREFEKPDPVPEPVSVPVPVPEVPPIDEPNESEVVTPMEPKKEKEIEVVKDEGWNDPEPQTNIIVARIAALLSVKSLITIALTVAFIILVVHGKDLPDQFVSIYTMCISFFFGYQFKKAEGGGE